jgi:hypothetical protein
MARTLTNVIPDLYEALDVVSRELVGFIPSVQSSMTAERAAVNQTVYSPVVSALSAADTSPAVTPPDTGDNAVTAVSVAITKSRHVAVRINGEQNRALNTGIGFSTIMANEFAQAMRTLVNEVEGDIGGEYVRASRAYGTAGTAPFATVVADAFQAQKILDDNGAPMGDRQLVINTSAALNLGSLTHLTSVNSAGTDSLLRRGELTQIAGFNVRKSAGIKTHTAGTTTLVTTTGYNASGTAAEKATNRVGVTELSVATGASTGALALTAGDVIAIADVAGLYVVTEAVTEAAAGTATIKIAAPGLIAAAPNSKAVTVRATNHANNLAFSRNAIVLATRAPAMPDGGDLAMDSTIVTDPSSGLSFEIRQYAQFAQTQYLVMLAWGVRCVKSEHCAILLG